jgi:hypothetical protein
MRITPTRKRPDPNARPQIERFREMAREMECDEAPDAFEVALREIATAGPPRKYEPKRRTLKKP